MRRGFCLSVTKSFRSVDEEGRRSSITTCRKQPLKCIRKMYLPVSDKVGRDKALSKGCIKDAKSYKAPRSEIAVILPHVTQSNTYRVFAGTEMPDSSTETCNNRAVCGDILYEVAS